MIRLNLLPQSRRAMLDRRRHRRFWTMAVACSLALGGLPGLVVLAREAQVRDMVEEFATLSERLDANNQQLKALDEGNHKLEEEIAAARALKAKRSWSALFGLVIENMPETIWLDMIQTEPPPPLTNPDEVLAIKPPAGATAGRVTIDSPRRLVLMGFSSDYPAHLAYEQRLRESGFFSNVKSGNVKQVGDDTQRVYRCSIICEW